MTDLDFKVQKGIIVSDGDIVVSNASGSSGEDANVRAKEFNTHGADGDAGTTSGLKIRGNDIIATANNSTSDLGIDLITKGTGSVTATRIDGTPIGGSTASTGAFTTLGASSTSALQGAVTLGNSTTNGILKVADAANDATGKYLYITAGQAADGTHANTAGGRLLIQGGAGKGSGAGGYIDLMVTPVGSDGGVNANTHESALLINHDKTSTFSGAATAPSFHTSNATAGITVSGSTISTDGSNSNIHLTLDPKGTGEIDAQAALDMNDLNIKHVDTAYIKNIDANQVGGSGTADVIHIGRTDNVVVGGTALADDSIAMQVNGGANATLNTTGQQGTTDADYTEVRLHVGVTENEATTQTYPKELVTLVLQNSDTSWKQGSKGIIFDNPTGNPGSDATGSTWGVGTTQGDVTKFVIGYAGSKQGWDNSTKGTTNSPLSGVRDADSQPLYMFSEGGRHDIQIGAHVNSSATANGLFMLNGAAHATAPPVVFEFTNAGVFKVYEGAQSNNNYFGFKAGTMSANLEYTLPTANGTDNQVLTLTSASNKTLGWSDASGGAIADTTGGDTNYLARYTDADSLAGDADLTFDGTSMVLGSGTDADHAFTLNSMINNDAGVKVNLVSDATDTVAYTTRGIEANVSSASTGNNGNLQTFIGMKSNVDISGNHASGTKTAVGLLVDVDSSTTTGTVNGFGLDVDVDGFDANYAAVFRSGLVGIGAVPDTAKLDITSTDTYGKALYLRNTYAPGAGSSANGSALRFIAERDGSEAGKALDTLGFIEFFGNDSGGTNQKFADIQASIISPTANSEKGQLSFNVATAGTNGAIDTVMKIIGGDTAATSEVFIAGGLTVAGELLTVNTTETVVEDKTLVIGVTDGLKEATYTRSSTTVTVTSTAHGFNNSEYVYISNAGNSITDGVYQVTKIDNNTFTFTGGSGTVAATALWHSTTKLLDSTADDAGIHIPGATLKKFTWDSSNGFSSTEDLDLASGKHYSINGTTVLSASALGSGVTSSSLTSVGTIGTGTWQGTAVADAYVANDLTISGGTINDTPIGASTENTGKFTTLQAQSLNVDAVALVDTSSAVNQDWDADTAYTIASFAHGTYRTVKYIGQIDNGAGSDVDAFEVLVTWKDQDNSNALPENDADVFCTTFAYIPTSGTPQGTISAVKNSGNIDLKFTPTSDMDTASYTITATHVIK